MHPTSWKKCLGGWSLFWGTSYSKGINLLLSPKDSISPIPLATFIIIIISRRAHLESGYGQSNAETWLREWKVYIQKTKKEEEKTFHCSYWFADAEATANQMGMFVCFFRNPDAWRRRRILWWIKKHLKRRRRRRSPVSDSVCVCVYVFSPQKVLRSPSGDANSRLTERYIYNPRGSSFSRKLDWFWTISLDSLGHRGWALALHCRRGANIDRCLCA